MFFSKTVKYIIEGLIFASVAMSSALAEPMRIAMMIEHEGFLMWYAHQQGWDKELGLDLALNITNTSGADIMNMEGKEQRDWDVAAVGVVPFSICSKNLPITVFAVANNESRATEIFARPDSDILQTRGYNQDYPNIYGSPKSVSGKTFFIREKTSSFYTLMTWIKVLGLNFKEINYKNVSVSDMVQEFSNSSAEGLVIWSPNSYEAIRNGYTHVASAESLKITVPIVLCAHTDYAEKHPEEMSKLVAVYYRATQEQRRDPHKMIKAYKKFLNAFTGSNFNDSFCKFDMQRHRVLTLDEQLDYFKEVNGQSKILEIRNNILDLFREVAADYGWDESYDAKDYPVTSTDRYLIEAQKYLK